MVLRIVDFTTHYQATLDPDLVDADGVIVKVSEGLSGASATGWRVPANSVSIQNGEKVLGLYHYGRLELNNPADEAKFFYNEVKDYVGKAVMILDFEDGSIGSGVQGAKTFLDTFTQLSGVRPLIYMSKAVVNQFDWSPVAKDYGLWVAQYGSYNPTGWETDPWTDNKGYGAFGSPTMFQYTSSGHIAGYNGNLDLSLFYGDKSAWQKFATAGNVTPKPVPAKVTNPLGDAVQVFKNYNNVFTAYGKFRVDEVAFVNGVWQLINYDLAGGKYGFDWTLNGIPWAIVNNLSRSNAENVQVGDWVKFDNNNNRGTVDAYDVDAVGIDFGKYGRIWFSANTMLRL